jgi:hypothetical protein
VEVLGEKPRSSVHHKSHTDKIPALRCERPLTNHMTNDKVFERKEMWIHLIEHGPIIAESQNRLANRQYRMLLRSRSGMCVIRFAVRVCIGFLDCYLLVVKRN